MQACPIPQEEYKMKFIGFFELLDADKAIEKFEKIRKMKKEDYEKVGLEPVKTLTPPYAFTDSQTGFQLFEVETLEPLYALAAFYYGSMNFEFKGYDEASSAIAAQMKVNKAFK
jgi:hypothetical protein